MKIIEYAKNLSKWKLAAGILASAAIIYFLVFMVPNLSAESNAALVGVIVGVLITEAVDWIRKKNRREKLNHLICGELETLKLQLNYRKMIIGKILREQQSRIFFPRLLIRSVTNAYREHLAEIHEVFDSHQRNHLHVIYQWTDIIDNEIFNLRNSIQPEEAVSDISRQKFSELVDNISFAEGLINDYLKGDFHQLFVFPE